MDSKTSALIRQYMGEFHPERNMAASFIYTMIDGKQKYMTTRNVQKLVKRYSDKVRENHDLPETVSPHTLMRTRGTMLLILRTLK